MYEFIRGPMVWIAFIVFTVGTIYQLISLYYLVKKDRVVIPYMSLKFGFRSLFHWVIPFASINMRRRPVMTIVSFLFHMCLLLTPLFLLSHVTLINMSWGVSWWSFSESLADNMTVIVILACIFFLARRIMLPEVRFVSFKSDFVLLTITVLPFITGFLAYHQIFHYKSMLILHILSGEVLLMAIPFTRLGHILYFAFTRAYMGSEFGAVRNSRDW